MRDVNLVVMSGEIKGDIYTNTSNKMEPFSKFVLLVHCLEKQKDGKMRYSDVDVSCTAYGKESGIASKYLYQGAHVTIAGTLGKSTYKKRDGTTLRETILEVKKIYF